MNIKMIIFNIRKGFITFLIISLISLGIFGCPNNTSNSDKSPNPTSTETTNNNNDPVENNKSIEFSWDIKSYSSTLTSIAFGDGE